jgi:hypothetical protein
MNRVIWKFGVKETERHPRQAFRLSLLAARHPKRVGRSIAVARRTSRLASTVTRAAADRKVRRQTRMAVVQLALAAQQAQRDGVVGALEGRHVVGHVRRAAKYAARAAAQAKAGQRRRSVARRAVATAGVCVVGGVTYAGWKRQFGSAGLAVTAPGESEPKDPLNYVDF